MENKKPSRTGKKTAEQNAIFYASLIYSVLILLVIGSIELKIYI